MNNLTVEMVDDFLSRLGDFEWGLHILTGIKPEVDLEKIFGYELRVEAEKLLSEAESLIVTWSHTKNLLRSDGEDDEITCCFPDTFEERSKKMELTRSLVETYAYFELIRIELTKVKKELV